MTRLADCQPYSIPKSVSVTATSVRRVGVIGTGAMGGGVVQSLVRAGIATVARDIRAEAQSRAVRHGAVPSVSPADLARSCDTVILLVVDAAQIETVLFGKDGAAAALGPGSVVLLGSTVDPAYPAALAPRLAEREVTLLDAPVSGGPAKAAAGTMTMMLSGDSAAIERVPPAARADHRQAVRAGRTLR